MTDVSVVVPTYNRRPRLESVLTALARQDLDGHAMEVVVVSDGSTDGTDDYLRSDDVPLEITVVAQPNQGVARARNAGVEAASGELVVFIDDDVVPEPECVRVHADSHARAADPTVVIGPLLTPETARLKPWVKWEQRMLYKQYDAMDAGHYAPTARQFYTGNASLPRELMVRSGGFDEEFRRAEDVELAYRLADMGVTFVFEPAARAFHHADRSYESWLATAHAYGRNDVIFWRDRGQSWLIPVLRSDYRRRSLPVRLFTRTGLRLPGLRRRAYASAEGWADWMDRLGTDGSGRRVLSAVYNLAYYESLTEEIGGVDRFLSVKPPPRRPAAVVAEPSESTSR